MPKLGYKTKSELVYEALWEKIAAGEIKPGERVSAAEIAEELSVSRTPVNEAMKKLADYGVINILPNVGFEVVTISWQEIEELNVIQSLLEEQALKWMEKGYNKQELDKLKEISADIKKAIEENDRKKYHTLSRSFHLGFIQLSGSKVLLDIYSKCWNYGGWDDSKVREFSQELVKINEEHDEMLALIEKGDFKKALEIQDIHITNCLDSLKKNMEDSNYPGLK